MREHVETRSKKFYERAKLVGVSASEVERGKTVAIIDVGLDHFHEWYVEETKLILRPLSSMMEEEAAHIGQLVYGKPDSVKWRVEHKNGYLKIYRKHYQKCITIDYASADLDFYDGDELDTSLRQVEIFNYLRKNSFDVDGLLESGRAVDATKMEKP